MQVGSPFYNKKSIQNLQKSLSGYFPILRLFTASCHSYPGGYWGFFFGSKEFDYSNFQQNLFEKVHIKNFSYYNKEIHYSCFSLPNYLLF